MKIFLMTILVLNILDGGKFPMGTIYYSLRIKDPRIRGLLAMVQCYHASCGVSQGKKCVIQSDQSQAGYERWRAVQELCNLENGSSVELHTRQFLHT